MSVEAFTIAVDATARLLEVRYPARPTMEAFKAYEMKVREAIEGLAKAGPWDCIVDQSALNALAPDFPPRIADLNTWAKKKGMRRAARLVSGSAVGELQTLRILREAGLKELGAVFHERQAALAFLAKP